jgi:hypothetical protein
MVSTRRIVAFRSAEGAFFRGSEDDKLTFPILSGRATRCNIDKARVGQKLLAVADGSQRR